MLLPLALAGSPGYLKNALLRRRLGCYGLRRKKKRMERSGSAPTAFRRAAWTGGSLTRGALAAAAERLRCWTAARYIRALAAGLGMAGKEVRRKEGPPWQLLRWRLGWKDMLLPLPLAGPAG